MFEKYTISPWFQLFAKQRIAEREHQYERLNNCQSVKDGILKKRQEYLGSDLELTMFVHENGKPIEKAVIALSSYLGSLTAYFLEKEYEIPDMEDLCYGFFYFALQLYAYDQVGCDSFDDLIQLAELFECDSEVMTIVLERDLPEEIVEDWIQFLTINDYVPLCFKDAVTGAVAVLLGVLKDPTTDNAA